MNGHPLGVVSCCELCLLDKCMSEQAGTYTGLKISGGSDS
jgi:hypothetical protein